MLRKFYPSCRSSVSLFDTGNGGQKRVAEPFAMRQIPPEAVSELAEFGFASKGLAGSAEAAQWSRRGRGGDPRQVSGNPHRAAANFTPAAFVRKFSPNCGTRFWRPERRLLYARVRRYLSVGRALGILGPGKRQ